MRVFLGMILGAALTVMGAYLYDSAATTTDPDSIATTHRPMVNWDVVGDNWRALRAGVERSWTRLSSNLD